MDKYQELSDLGAFTVFGTGEPGAPAGLRGRDGRVFVAPEAGYCEFSECQEGYITARRADGGKTPWCLIDYNGRLLASGFTAIECAGEGTFRVKKGAKYNLLRADGTLVLPEAMRRVSDVHDGYFTFGTTIARTKDTPTRRLEGIAHVDGTVVFPPLFEECRYTGDDQIFAIRKDGDMYFSHHGSLYDPAKQHYPPLGEHALLTKAAKDAAAWILPGLKFHYRDTDMPVDLADYPVGRALRAGFTIDASQRLGRPARRTRFLIAGAHSAVFVDENGNMPEAAAFICPNADLWRQVKFHKNTWFKVMDVYELEGVTQIFLLQVPYSLVVHTGHAPLDPDSGQGEGMAYSTLVASARASLARCMKETVLPRSLDPELVKLMERPVGTAPDGGMAALEPDIAPAPDDMSDMISKLVHTMADDFDITRETDGFPWRGVTASVCEGCVHAGAITDRADGCALLGCREFRRRYMDGACPDRSRTLPGEPVSGGK